MYIKVEELIIARDIEGPAPGKTGKVLFINDRDGNIYNEDGSPYSNPDSRFYTYCDPEPQSVAPSVFNSAPESQPVVDNPEPEQTIHQRILELTEELSLLEAAPDKDAPVSSL